MSTKEAPEWLRHHTSRIMTTGVVLALLYLGRTVLIPLALAIMLSLLVAPLVRALRRLGVGRTSSVLVCVVVLTVSGLGIAVALGTQVLRIGEGLPQYESNIQGKLKTMEEMIVGPLLRLNDETSWLIDVRESVGHARDLGRPLPASAPSVAAHEPLAFGSHPVQLM
jgi:predicted PurR-regulated permease PerM